MRHTGDTHSMAVAERLTHPEEAAELFAGWEETMVYSVLEGVLGAVYAVMDKGLPVSAVCIAADFAFFAGIPSPILLTYDYGKPFLILTPRDRAWQDCMEKTLLPEHRTLPDAPWDMPLAGAYGRVQRTIRYAIRKDTVFDRARLIDIRDHVPVGYTLHPIGKAEYSTCQSMAWSRDFVSNYPTYAAYRAYARGYVIRECKNDTIVAGASAYTHYSGGIEIEVDTRKEHRNRGLATVCAAALILDCLDNGLYPSWDAANLTSVHIAERLGYTMAHPYTVFYLLQ